MHPLGFCDMAKMVGVVTESDRSSLEGEGIDLEL